MLIDEKLLYEFGAEKIIFKTGDIIFREQTTVIYYFQIIKGDVKLNNFDDEGKESIQNIIGKGRSVGLTFLYLNHPYLVNAIAVKPTEILRLPKSVFFKMIKSRPHTTIKITETMAESVYYKTLMHKNNSTNNSTTRLKGLMDYLKNYKDLTKPYSYVVPLTRQQMAGLTGLCVETVIRTIKLMESKEMLVLVKGKIHY